MTTTAAFDPHSAVTNQLSEQHFDASLVQAPSSGESQGASSEALKDNSHEPVKGYKSTKPNKLESIAHTLTQLRDIGEASFGPLVAPITETVHPPDDRIRITTTNVYPWSAIAHLLITAADNSLWVGTGWFIGPHTLATAGHVVYIKNSGVPGRDGWVKSIQVIPGRNGDSQPFGSIASTRFFSVTGWTNGGDQNFDYGAIVLPSDLGNRTGWFGFGVYSDADLRASIGNISGYPGDKPSGTQWFDSQQIAAVDASKVYYDIDTAGGQSGSAVFRIINGQRYGIAVHAYGGATTNSGTRIITSVFNNFVAWKA